MTLVLCVLLALGAWALGVQVLGQLAVFWLVGRRASGKVHHQWGVTVLKPLKGADPGLERNLHSIFQQDWHKFELVFGAADADEPALQLVRRLAAQYPHVPVRVVTSYQPLGLNPKVNLCAELAEHARYDLVLISDASVEAPRDYIRGMVECFSRPNTGLVSSPLVGFGETTPGGAIDNLILNLFILRAVCFVKLFVRHSCVIGKSMMFRLSDLRRLGGWRQVAGVLAEDYILGRLFRRAGFDVRLCPMRLPTRTHCGRLRDGMNRHLRWCQMRRRTSFLGYVAELGANVTVWALALILAALLVDVYTTAFVLCGVFLLGAKLAIDLASILWLTPRGASWFLVRWVPLAELLNFWVWLQGTVKRTVDWRGTHLVIGAQTRLTPIRHTRSSRTSEVYSAANP